MRASLITLVFVVLAGALSGCGQKGPLYLEEPEQTSTGAGDQPGSDTTAERPESEDSDR